MLVDVAVLTVTVIVAVVDWGTCVWLGGTTVAVALGVSVGVAVRRVPVGVGVGVGV